MYYGKILDVIADYSLPISRGSLPVTEFLKGHYKNYINSLETALSNDDSNSYYLNIQVKEHMKKIREMCDKTIEILECYNHGKLFASQQLFNNYMEDMEPFIRSSENGFYRSINTNYYRIRKSEEKSLTRKEMFHIPMNKRESIQSYRYSIPGYPCLYLANQGSLCWFE